MFYVFKKALKGRLLFDFLCNLTLTLFQVSSAVAISILLNYLTEILNGTFIISLSSKYYETINHVSVLTDEGQKIASVVLMFIMLGIGLFGLVCGIISGILGAKIAVYALNNLRLEMYNKIQQFSNADINHFKKSSLITRLTTDVYKVQEALVFVLRNLFGSSLQYLGGVIGAIILVAISKNIPNGYHKFIWVVPIVLIVISVVAIGLISMLVYFSSKLNEKEMKMTDATNNIMGESIEGIKVTKVLNLQNYQEQKFAIVNQNLTSTSIKTNILKESAFPTVTLAMNITIVAVLGLGSLTFTVGITEVITLIQLITLMMMGMIFIVVCVAQLGAAAPSVKRMKNIVEWKPSRSPVENKNDFKNGDIELKNVTFKYFADAAPVLENINLKINQNQKVGVIGVTGSGKSTLVNLIANRYLPSEGNLLINNKDIKNINTKSFKKAVAIVFQKAMVFSGTIKSNLLIGKPDASQSDLEYAAEYACAKEFIDAKPLKFEEPIEQNGANLSGGQKQRICISRALIHDPQILILDDSTSALDMITEKNVQENIANHFKNTTVIYVAQRISAVKNLDKIIVLKDGKIVGDGTHEELLNNCDEYIQIANSQKESEVQLNG